VDSSGAIIVGGYSESTDLDSQSNAGNADVMVMKFSSAGAHQWTVLHGGSSSERAAGLEAERASTELQDVKLLHRTPDGHVTYDN